MSAPVVATGHFLLAEAGSRGWHAHDVGDRRWRNVGGHAWEGETVRSCHPLSASLWAYCWRCREGAVRAGMADGVETASFHDHRYTGVVIFCWSLLIPERAAMRDSMRAAAVPA